MTNAATIMKSVFKEAQKAVDVFLKQMKSALANYVGKMKLV